MQVCADIKEEDKETGAVLKCLVKNVDTVSDTCSKEISRSLRAAFQFYQPVSPLSPHQSATKLCPLHSLSMCIICREGATHPANIACCKQNL